MPPLTARGFTVEDLERYTPVFEGMGTRCLYIDLEHYLPQDLRDDGTRAGVLILRDCICSLLQDPDGEAKATAELVRMVVDGKVDQKMWNGRQKPGQPCSTACRSTFCCRKGEVQNRNTAWNNTIADF
eukprot:5476244-Prymnesium_polylepis.2